MPVIATAQTSSAPAPTPLAPKPRPVSRRRRSTRTNYWTAASMARANHKRRRND
jgi:hypothetical protein